MSASHWFDLVKYGHLLGGLSFFGVIIANYLTILISHDRQTALLRSVELERWLFMLIPWQFFSAIILIQLKHLSSATPWISVAFIAFAVASALWLSSWYGRRRLVQAAQLSDSPTVITWSRGHWARWQISNIFIILIFIVIVHDAVAKHTIIMSASLSKP